MIILKLRKDKYFSSVKTSMEIKKYVNNELSLWSHVSLYVNPKICISTAFICLNPPGTK